MWNSGIPARLGLLPALQETKHRLQAQTLIKWSHAGSNRGPYGYWPYALTN